MKRIILLVTILLVQNTFSQIKKFGKVSNNEFGAIKKTEFKDANAIVLFKTRKAYYEYGTTGILIHNKVHERIKILNNDGYIYTTKRIFLYKGNGNIGESIRIKANTYNLVDGEIVKTKLKKSNIFTTEKSENWREKAFTMPNVKEGSIIEWEYEVSSPYIYYINDFVFQNDIPIKKYEASIVFPEQLSARYEYTDRFPIKFTQEKGFEIAIDNVEALKVEPYTNNIENHRGKVSFEITKSVLLTRKSSRHVAAYETNNLSNTWEDVSKSLFKDKRFGDELKKTSYFKEDLRLILRKNLTKEEQIEAVLLFVKNKVKWDGKNRVYTKDGVKVAYNNGIGNVAEINIILTAMLREAGLDANPVLVSTRSHGKPIFPTRKGFNYVIVSVELPNKILLLDATEKYSSVNNLPQRVLNWKGRIIRKGGSSSFIDLYPKEYNIYYQRLNVKLDEFGTLKGYFKNAYKNLNAIINRRKYNNLSEEALITSLEAKFSPIEIQNVRLNNKENLKKPFLITLGFLAENQAEKIGNKMYLSPLFFLKESENIFKTESRKFPVNFSSAWLKSRDVQIEIPNDYSIEILPKTAVINTVNNIASFSYTIIVKENKIFLNTTTKINTPIVLPHLYKELKDFYAAIILKMNEKVVLVKK